MKVQRIRGRCAIVLMGILTGMLLGGSVFGATVVLNPTADTYVDEYTPNDLNGAKNWVIVRRGGSGFTLNTLLKFDLSSFPFGTTINSAKLGLYYYGYSDGDPVGKTLTVHHITGSWSEATTTWNTRPSYNPVPVSSTAMPGQYSWVEWDLTTAVQNVVNGVVQDFGWEVIDPSTGGYFSMIDFRPKEYGSNIPYLEIDTGLAVGWYWKPEQPNYAPSGMPDFDMKQDAWKTIYPGSNGVIESAVGGDDEYIANYELIASGPNCELESTPAGDDYADWSFSGPTAVANCFWWFDSKFGNPEGYPGDMQDEFPLVEGYEATGKVVDQEQTLHFTWVDLTPYIPGHVQSFVPTVPVLDAVQLLLKFNWEGVPEDVEISIYGSLPDNPGVGALGTTVKNVSGPWAAQWYQFHFDPQISLTPGATYFIGARVLGQTGNVHWCYIEENPYPYGMGWECWAGDYALVPYPQRDYAFRTEYYDSGQLDDHEADNVPYLIEELATLMGTCDIGFTEVNYMQEAIDFWFIDQGLDGMFEENTYTAPEFEFIEGEIERSQDVILMLGFYGEKLVDQQQLQWDWKLDLYPWMPGHLQGFTPTVSILDAVQLLLQADSLTPTTVQVDIYDNLPTSQAVTPIASSIRVISVPWYPEWFQFHFEPPVNVNPQEQYYIAVRTLDVENNVEWCHISYDLYPGGEAWFNWADYTLQQEGLHDFGFKTEYYEEDNCTMRAQHYVTCAGVNSDYLQIAFSDPLFDIGEGAMGNSADHEPHAYDGTVHNDPQYVSHDIYSVVIGPPCQSSGASWWIPDYPSGYAFTTVEYAVVICPTEECDCMPGDANNSGNHNILDVTYLINYLYKGGPVPTPYALCSGDPNCSCSINILDVTYIINYLYKGGPPPCSCQAWLSACGPPLRK